MRLLTVLSFVTFIVTLYAGIYVFRHDRRSRVNVMFLLICAFTCVWSFCYAFVYSAPSSEDAAFWAKMASIGWLPLPVTGMYFYLALAGKTKAFKSVSMLAFLVAPIPFFGYQYYSSVFKPSLFVLTDFGYAEQIDLKNVWVLLYDVYAFCVSFAGITVGILEAIRINDKSYKRQLVLVVCGAALTVIIALAGTVLFPVLGFPVFPDIAPIALGFMIGSLWYVIVRYRFMVVTTETIADEILNVMSDSLLFISTNGIISISNRAAEKVFRYTREELIGKKIGMLCAERNVFDVFYIKKAMEVDGLSEEVIVFVTKRGERVPMSCTFSVMRDRYGKATGIVVLMRDIREKLELESKEAKRTSELEKAYHDLERTQAASLNIMEDLEKKGSELGNALNILKETQAKLLQNEKMAAVGKLAGGVAHEINNPMTVILGYAQNIVRKMRKDDPNYEALRAVESEALRCKKLIYDLLTFSRSTKVKFEKVDLSGVIDGAVSLLNPQARLKGVKIVHEIEGALPQLDANPNHLQQVLINLGNNAIDAMGKGGELTITARAEANSIVMTVRDTGSGIPSGELGRIFEPFYTTKSVGKGTGLGLSLCYEFVKKHNGEILVESKVNEGSVFTVTLPISQNVPE